MPFPVLFTLDLHSIPSLFLVQYFPFDKVVQKIQGKPSLALLPN